MPTGEWGSLNGSGGRVRLLVSLARLHDLADSLLGFNRQTRTRQCCPFLGFRPKKKSTSRNAQNAAKSLIGEALGRSTVPYRPQALPRYSVFRLGRAAVRHFRHVRVLVIIWQPLADHPH
jgi:hypothetical protein